MSSRRPWPFRLAAREGLATARSGRWTSLLVIAAVAWLCAAPGAADAIAITHLVDGERAWINAGAFAFAVTGAPSAGSQAGPVPVGPCDRLAKVPGVTGSFAARRSADSAALGHIPGGRMSLIEVSPGAAAYLGATAAPNGVVMLTRSLAARTGVGDGETVTVVSSSAENGTSRSDLLTTRIVDTTAIGAEYDGTVLIPTLRDGDAATCFVRTDAAHVAAVKQLLPAVLAREGKLAVVNPQLYAGKFTANYATAYQDRQLRWVWVITGALIGLLWSLIQWFRRSHVAIYTTFGMRTHSRLVMQVSEWSALALAGGLWGWAIGTIGAMAYGARAATAAGAVGYHVLLTVIVASAVVVLMGLRPTGSLLNALKDR